MSDGTLDVLELTNGPIPITSIEVSPKSINRKPDAIRLNLQNLEQPKDYGNLDQGNAQKWTFIEERPLVGIHGRMNDDLQI